MVREMNVLSCNVRTSGANETELGKIDWIFTRGALVPTAAKIIRDAEDGRYPSDHYFISTTLKI